MEEMIKKYGNCILVGMALAMIFVSVILFAEKDECVHTEEKTGLFEYEVNGATGTSYKCETVIDKNYCMIRVNGYADYESEVN